MRFLIVILITFIANIKGQNNSVVNDISLENLPQLSPLILAPNKTCVMYTECRVDFLVEKSLEIAHSYDFETTDDFVFTVDSTELCADEVKAFNDFNLPAEANNQYKCYSLKINTNVFGAAYLKVLDKRLKKDETNLLIIINEPRRIVDKIFDVWVWVFQVVVSILMGCLLDYETLKKIIKMPYPVLIGKIKI